MKQFKIKYLKAYYAAELNINDYPNFHIKGNITGMRKIYTHTSQYYRNDERVLLVRCGGYIYHVPETIYNQGVYVL